jgi:hypothetical protein
MEIIVDAYGPEKQAKREHRLFWNNIDCREGL